MKINNPVYLSLSFMILLIPFQGCGQKKVDHSKSIKDSTMNEWNKSIPGSFSTQTKSKFDSLEIGIFIKQFPQLKKYEKIMNTFYNKREMAFAWFDKDGLIEHASNLTDRVRNLQYDGLSKELPYAHMLDSMMYEVNMDKVPDSVVVNLELMLTAQYFAFADVVWDGMDASVSKKVDWNLPRKKVS